MAYAYTAVVVFDFIVAPILWSIMQVAFGTPDVQWKSITLDTGGLFHAAMGAVLGVSAYTRGQEKIERVRREVTPLTAHELEQQMPRENFHN
jgi:hypothetical protein